MKPIISSLTSALTLIIISCPRLLVYCTTSNTLLVSNREHHGDDDDHEMMIMLDMLSTPSSSSSSSSSSRTRVRRRQNFDQGSENIDGWHSKQIHHVAISSDGRALIGSAPPKCIGKCAKCTPCQPVRVPIRPGQVKVGLMEYYPEAWRCKCKNKLYMP